MNVCVPSTPYIQSNCNNIVLRKDLDSVYIKEYVPKEININSGESAQITAIIEPADTKNPIGWTSTNIEVATVTSEGLVIAVEPGSTIITGILNSSTILIPVTVSAAASIDEPEGSTSGKGDNSEGLKKGSDYGTINLGHATYTGPLKNGKPHGANGVLKFKTQHIIESRDVKRREAQPGETVIGVFEDGHLVSGTLKHNDGNPETIII